MMDDIFRILIVDDETSNIKVLVDLLKDDYQIIVAKSGEQALNRVRETMHLDLILLDVMMPQMDGYEVCRQLKEDERTRGIPVMFITALDAPEDEEKGLQKGALDYIVKPFSPSIVKARVRNHLQLKQARDMLERQAEILEEKVGERTREVSDVQSVAIMCLASLAETRDNETGNHIRRTQNYIKVIAEKLAEQPKYKSALNPRSIAQLCESAPLHDIGKVGVPDAILLKPGKLTTEEFEEMKKHTIYGHEALMVAEKTTGTQSSLFLSYAKEVTLTHHEKWDGSGYPYGLRGKEIPLSGLLMAVADVYDALISRRVYKAAFSHDKAMDIIRQGRGQHFAPDIIDALMAVESQVIEISKAYSDHE